MRRAGGTSAGERGRPRGSRSSGRRTTGSDAFWRLHLIERVHRGVPAGEKPEGGEVVADAIRRRRARVCDSQATSLGDSSFRETRHPHRARKKRRRPPAARRDALRAKWLSEEAKREALAASFADVEAASRDAARSSSRPRRGTRRQRELEAAADVGAAAATAGRRGGASSSSKSRRTTRWTSRRSASARISRSSCPRRSSRSVRTGTGAPAQRLSDVPADISLRAVRRAMLARTCTRRLRATSRSL